MKLGLASLNYFVHMRRLPKGGYDIYDLSIRIQDVLPTGLHLTQSSTYLSLYCLNSSVHQLMKPHVLVRRY